MKKLTFILVLAAMLRLALLACAWNNAAGVCTPDSIGYLDLSRSLAAGSFSQGGAPDIFRPPGYPAFLLIGAGFDGDNAWRAALIVQVALDVLLVALTYVLGRTLCDARTGLWAAVLQALSAVAIAASLRVLSDGPFAMLLTLSFLLLFFHLKSADWGPLVLAAFTLGAATYLRAVGQVYVVIIAAFLALGVFNRVPAGAAADLRPAAGGKGRRIMKRLVAAAVFVAVAAATVAPWVARNAARADFVGFSSFGPDSLYGWAAPEILVRTEHISPLEVRQRMQDLDRQDADKYPRQSPRTPGQAAHFRAGVANQLVRDHLALYLWLHLKGTVGFFLPGATDVLEIAGVTSGQRGTSDVLRSQGVWAAAKFYFEGNAKGALLAVPMLAVYAFQMLGVLICIVKRFRLRMPMEFWLLAALIVITSLLSGPYGFPRYRTGIEPLLNLVAAAGWLALLPRGRRNTLGEA